MSASDRSSQEPDDLLVVNSRIRIPRDEFRFTFVRSSGPGGQNVNKVATKAQMRWAVVDSPSLSTGVKERFLAKYRRRVTNEGELVMSSQRFRDQTKNVIDCFDKLREMIASVATAPTPRKKTKPSRGAKERRIKQKRQQSGKKNLRRKPGADD